jgi:hypothetical protein
MSSTVRTLGWLLILLATAVLTSELFTLAETGRFELSSLGDVWRGLHPESLRVVQATVEGQVSVALWDRLLAPLLPYKAVLVFALPGFLLASLPALIELVNRMGEHELA